MNKRAMLGIGAMALAAGAGVMTDWEKREAFKGRGKRPQCSKDKATRKRRAKNKAARKSRRRNRA
jgi:hypothetical protein